MLRPGERRQRLLEVGDLRPHDEAAGRQHAPDGGVDLRRNALALGLKVDEVHVVVL